MDDYPRSSEQWSGEIDAGLGLDPGEGKKLLESGEFPYSRLKIWLNARFALGYGADFLPSLMRNLQDLVEWVYGDGPEPDWSAEG
jgi:hypothetical protein